MSKIEIDTEKCTGCGNCIKDCITYSLEADENNKAQVSQNGESLCISCQHCFAICPVGAIKFNDKKPEDASPIRDINSKDILDLIKSRRSIRQFKDEEIPADKFNQLKEMLPYIPTGCNYNGLHFSIIESKSAMDDNISGII